MKFQKKIIVIYSVFAVIASLIVGTIYYLYNSTEYRDSEYQNMNVSSKMVLQQVDDMIQKMEDVSDYILSDPEVLDAIKTLSGGTDNDAYSPTYLSDSVDTIRESINTYYIWKNFNRVILFNQSGTVIAGRNIAGSVIDSTVSIEDLTWVGEATGFKGTPVIIGAHIDDWGKKTKPVVFSVVKEIQGSGLGFIEVQKKISDLDELFMTENQDTDIIVVRDNGELIYANNEDLATDSFLKAILSLSAGTSEIKNPDTGQKIAVSIQKSAETGVTVAAVRAVNITYQSLLEALPVTLIVVISFLVISFLYINITSKYVTEPIHELQKFMENTEIGNMDDEIQTKISNDEIESLYESYKAMLNRLNKSTLKEKRMSMLQLQAQFDLLQAQVNPHFLFNVLNVISTRGILAEDEVICEICDNLACMLRYATNTKEKHATVKEEIEYLNLYFTLLKYRYEHKLEYSIDLDAQIMDRELPKIVLQQVVENSIMHGYTNSNRVINIEVTGYCDQSKWYIKVHDNGDGFGENVIEEIYGKCRQARAKLSEERKNVEMEIGGMGLVNTYARLFLFYNESLIFELHSSESGTDVIIGAYITAKEEGESNV